MGIYTTAAWSMDSSSAVCPGFHKMRAWRSKRKKEGVECEKQEKIWVEQDWEEKKEENIGWNPGWKKICVESPLQGDCTAHQKYKKNVKISSLFLFLFSGPCFYPILPFRLSTIVELMHTQTLCTTKVHHASWMAREEGCLYLCHIQRLKWTF